MTPTSTDCIPEQFQFKRVKARQVIVNFQGGTVTSDAGLTLIADLDQKLKLTSRLAACFQDYRQPNRIEHSLSTLVAQRVYGLVQGYEDLNDHEQLRHDPMFALAIGKIIGEGTQSVVLAGKSTLNRLEHCPETVTNRVERGGKSGFTLRIIPLTQLPDREILESVSACGVESGV